MNEDDLQWAALPPGAKVYVTHHEGWGFGEIADFHPETREADVRFYAGPSGFATERVSFDDLARDRELPRGTRCYVRDEGAGHTARVIGLNKASEGPVRRYDLRFPNKEEGTLDETEFRVRAYRDPADPVGTLAALAHETPFFFERRTRFVRQRLEHLARTRGCPALARARLEAFTHQLEAARRVLYGSRLRWVLADEPGLGKTTELGLILAQLLADLPDLEVGVFVAPHQVSVWGERLRTRFDLSLPIAPHAELGMGSMGLDLVVIDDAQRLLPQGRKNRRAWEDAQRAAKSTPHLLLAADLHPSHDPEGYLELVGLLDPHEAARQALLDQLDDRAAWGARVRAVEQSPDAEGLKTGLQTLRDAFPHDPHVQAATDPDAVAEAVEDDEFPAELRVHLGEAHRLHPAWIRQTRAQLSEAERPEPQRPEPEPQLELADQTWERLWAALEAWRQAALAQAPEAKHDTWAQAYVDLAVRLAANPAACAEYAKSQIRDKECESFEVEHLRALIDAATISPDEDRVALLYETLENRLARDGESASLIVFCHDPAQCRAILARDPERAATLGLIGAHSGLSPDARNDLWDAFASDPDLHFVLTDPEACEGVDLRNVRGLLWYDLPWDPARVERALLAVDTLDRGEALTAWALLSHDDDAQAFDTAWFYLLLDGFRVFHEPLGEGRGAWNDLRAVLARAAFTEGPSGLAEQLDTTRQAVQAARDTCAALDVFDALPPSDLEPSPLGLGLDASDRDSAEFGFALSDYLWGCLRVATHKNQLERREWTFQAKVERPLVPLELIEPLSAHLERSSTAARTLASHRPELDLLRPGHPLVEETARLAAWDDRGRAFALWRPAPTENVVTVYRFVWRIELDEAALAPRLAEVAPDRILRASLLRRLRAYVPPRLEDGCVDAKGQPVPPAIETLCRDAYDDDRDLNLGGKRAHVLAQLLGDDFPEQCARVYEAARHGVLERPSSLAACKRARAEAHEDDQARRLRAEARAAMEPLFPLPDALSAREDAWAELAQDAPNHLKVELEAVGLYLLSRAPVAES